MPAQGILYDIQRMSIHDGPGLRTTVFFKGCPLRCLWCSNPESQNHSPQLMFFANLCVGCGRCLSACRNGAIVKEDNIFSRDFSNCGNCGDCAALCPAGASAMSGREYGVSEVMSIIRKDAGFYNNSGGGVTFSGGECTAQGAFLLALIESCRAEGIHTCVDTCGYTEPELFGKILDMADLLLFDVKHMVSNEHKRLTGVPNELILKNLMAAMSAHPEKITIRVPLMPGLNDAKENISAMAAMCRPYGIGKVDILPCHAFANGKYEALKLQRPTVSEYINSELRDVLQLFADCGLKTEIV